MRSEKEIRKGKRDFSLLKQIWGHELEWCLDGKYKTYNPSTHKVVPIGEKFDKRHLSANPMEWFNAWADAYKASTGKEIGLYDLATEVKVDINEIVEHYKAADSNQLDQIRLGGDKASNANAEHYRGLKLGIELLFPELQDRLTKELDNTKED